MKYNYQIKSHIQHKEHNNTNQEYKSLITKPQQPHELPT